MPTAASARRYAQAVFQIALEKDELDGWLEDLTLLATATENAEFSEFLDAPQVPDSQTFEVITSTLGDRVGPLAINLLALLASRNIANTVPSIVEQYQRLLDAHRGIERAEVVSAVPLDDAQRRQIEELLGGLVGKEVRLTSRVELGIVGGLVARVGDRVIDGSTRTRLQAMRRELVEQLH